MNNNNNISLSNLRDHSVAPPSFLFEKIKDSIEEQQNEGLKQSLQPLYAHAVMPPPQAVSFGAIMNRIKETDELNTFKPLRDYEVKAPISFARLMEIIRSLVTNQVTKPSAKVIPISSFKKIAAAAAVIIAIIGVYFIFQKNNTYNASNNPSIAVTTPTVLNNNTATTPITTPTPDTNSTTKNTLATIDLKGKYGHSKNNIFGKSFNPNAYGVARKTESLPIKDMTINGAVIPIIDNDYLATFTSFDPNNLPLFLQADNPVATSITVDQYTSITISEGMGAMMKKMYKTRKSGKPTRRARKQREKLEKWKKIDSDYFNQNSTSNPLDPFDLGNFILNK